MQLPLYPNYEHRVDLQLSPGPIEKHDVISHNKYFSQTNIYLYIYMGKKRVSSKIILIFRHCSTHSEAMHNSLLDANKPS